MCYDFCKRKAHFAYNLMWKARGLAKCTLSASLEKAVDRTRSLFVNENSDERIIGKRVLIKSCQATVHDYRNECVCLLLDRIVRISKVGALVPDTYEIAGGTHYVKRSQVVLLPDRPRKSKR